MLKYRSVNPQRIITFQTFQNWEENIKEEKKSDPGLVSFASKVDQTFFHSLNYRLEMVDI